MKQLICSAILLLVLCGVASGQVRVTYLANEGFLLEGGGRKVLVDALFGEGLSGYVAVPSQMRAELEAARPPFDDVDIVLASHHHGDHFDPSAVRRFLAASPGTRFLSTPQAASALGQPEWGLLPGEGETILLQFRVPIQVLNLHHGRQRRPPVQNLGFIVTLGGRKVLHIGDTEADVDDFRTALPPDTDIDVALLPAWYLTYPRWVRVVREVIQPKSIVVMHLASPQAPAGYFGPDGSYEGRLERIRANYPEALIPQAPGESYQF